MYCTATCSAPPTVMIKAMRPRPKLRTFCRWMLTILVVALVVVWIGSGWYSVFCMDNVGFKYIFRKGLFSADSDIRDLTGNEHTGLDWAIRSNGSFGLFFGRWDWAYKDWRISITLPMWAPCVFLTIPTALMWRNEIIARRRKPGTCFKCGYDRSGLAASSNCPECGTAFKVEVTQTSAS
jgi:hypothetical protein